MKAPIVFLSVLISACATAPVLRPGGKAPPAEPQVIVLLEDIHFRMPGSGWSVANEQPPGVKAFLVERSTSVALAIGVKPGSVKQVLKAKRGGLEGEQRNAKTLLTDVERTDDGQILLFRIYDLDDSGRPYHCMFYAVRRLTADPERTASVMGMWDTENDGRYVPLALDLLRSVNYSSDK